MKVLLGVSGGIAAYKAADLTSQLVKAEHAVRVVMTANATKFVGALTFEGLSAHPVMLDTFGDAMAHIEWAKWADVACVAPLSANTLSKLACGLADDALSTTLMALPRGRRCVLAPAMNTEMWLHPVVQRNLGWLRAMDRYVVVDPTEKRLACGDFGPGALADTPDIAAAILVAGAESRP